MPHACACCLLDRHVAAALHLHAQRRSLVAAHKVHFRVRHFGGVFTITVVKQANAGEAHVRVCRDSRLALIMGEASSEPVVRPIQHQ